MILVDAAQEKQEGKQGQWQQASSSKKILEQVRRSADANCGPQTLRRASSAVEHCNWESFQRKNTGRKESSVNGPLKEFGQRM